MEFKCGKCGATSIHMWEDTGTPNRWIFHCYGDCKTEVNVFAHNEAEAISAFRKATRVDEMERLKAKIEQMKSAIRRYVQR